MLELRRPWMGWKGIGAVFEAKFMLPWSFSEEAAAEKRLRSGLPVH